MRDENQLHAAVVELIALDDAEIKYSTVQNWYPGDAEGKGGIYNFVTKRADCRAPTPRFPGPRSRPARRSPGSTRPASCAARTGGRVLFHRHHQQSPAGRYRHQDDPPRQEHQEPRIISKGIAAGFSQNTYRGQVSAHRKATNARNFTQCDSLLIGKHCGAHTVPYIEARNASAKFEHEATTTRLSEDQLFYAMQRGLTQEEAVQLLVNGFVKDVLQELPMEFAVEAQKLIGISLEGSVG